MRVVVLAGGYDQIALIQQFKQHGHTVVLVDYNALPVAAPYADKHYPDSTMDIERVKQIVLLEQAELVVTACTDQALIIAAQVSEELGLPFPLSYELARSLTNKKWMKQVLCNNDIPTARHFVVTNESEMAAAAQMLQFPLVCKPTDANSSKGVTKVETQATLFSAYQYALENSRSRTVIIEEFVAGTELSVDAWVDADGKASVLLVSESIKNPSTTNNFPISASFYPVCSQGYITSFVAPIVQAVAEGFGLKNTPLLVQVIANAQGVSVLELSARMGGGCKHILIEAVTGLDTISMLVKSFLGGQVVTPDVKAAERIFLMKYLYADNGWFNKVLHTETEALQEIILGFYPTRPVETEIRGCATSSDRVGAFLICADTKDELLQKMHKVYDTITVQSAEGSNLLIRDDLEKQLSRSCFLAG